MQAFSISTNAAGVSATLSISATAHDFFLLATRKEDPDTLFFSPA
jgi:predicted lipid carrier protein YhbT